MGERGLQHFVGAAFDASLRSVDPATVLDSRRAAALAEIALYRSTLASLTARLPNLEAFIAAAGPSESSNGLDEIIRGFGNPVTALPPEPESDGPPPKRMKRDDPVEDLESAAVEASVSLEFAVSR